MPKPPTQRDIARELGISQTTVSFALRGEAGVSDEVRRQVLAAAEKLGYRPDPLLSRLAASKWETGVREAIGLLWTGDREGIEADATAAREQAKAMGFGLDLIHLTREADADETTALLQSRGIRGFVGYRIQNLEFIQRFPWQEFAAVAVRSRQKGAAPVDCILSDAQAIATIAWDRVRAAGYRRPGIVVFAYKDGSRNLRYHAPLLDLQARDAAQIEQVPILEISTTNRDLIRDWYVEHRPDVLIAETCVLARALLGIGVRFPQDCGLVTLRCVGAIPNAIVSSIDERSGAMLRHAVTMVAARLQANNIGLPDDPVQVNIAPKWIDGDTLPGSRLP